MILLKRHNQYLGYTTLLKSVNGFTNELYIVVTIVACRFKFVIDKTFFGRTSLAMELPMILLMLNASRASSVIFSATAASSFTFLVRLRQLPLYIIQPHFQSHHALVHISYALCHARAMRG